jgi:hypothetical protein
MELENPDAAPRGGTSGPADLLLLPPRITQVRFQS